MLNKISARALTEELGQPPRGSGNQLTSARCAIYRASTLHKQPEKATVLYLRAAQLLEGEDSHWATQAYEQAMGTAIELIGSHKLWNQTLSYKHLSYTISHSADSKYTDASALNKIYYANRYYSSVLTPAIKQKGNGISMVAHYPNTDLEDKSEEPFQPYIGYLFSVNAQPRWMDSNKLNIHLRRSIKNPSDAYDYTIPHTMIEKMTKELVYEGVVGVFQPNADLNDSGLYAYEPIDPTRIPVILVHGLASSPNLWVKPTHKLLQDPTIRNNYQFYTFYYRTGLPISANATTFKESLAHLHKYLKKQGAGRHAEQMVVIGHSMGGLLASAVTRDYRGATEEIYTKHHSDLVIDNTLEKKVIDGMLNAPPLNCITRTIFVATPHRGSEYANNWIGQITSYFIELPQQVVQLDPKHYREDLTSLGKSLFHPAGGFDGVQRLKFNNPSLLYNLSRPKLPNVTYHSIIGDRGFPGKLENSSDGVVTYQSSHLDEAVSEKIVPAWHNAEGHDESIKEMRRILHLHLKNN